jgi:hypothetical protein
MLKFKRISLEKVRDQTFFEIVLKDGKLLSFYAENFCVGILRLFISITRE